MYAFVCGAFAYVREAMMLNLNLLLIIVTALFPNRLTENLRC